jgi:hypothetical protein
MLLDNPAREGMSGKRVGSETCASSLTAAHETFRGVHHLRSLADDFSGTVTSLVSNERCRCTITHRIQMRVKQDLTKKIPGFNDSQRPLGERQPWTLSFCSALRGNRFIELSVSGNPFPFER